MLLDGVAEAARGPGSGGSLRAGRMSWRRKEAWAGAKDLRIQNEAEQRYSAAP